MQNNAHQLRVQRKLILGEACFFLSLNAKILSSLMLMNKDWSISISFTILVSVRSRS